MNDTILPLYDYVKIVKEAVLALSESTIISRRAAYERVSKEVISRLENRSPPVAPDAAIYEIRLFHYTTRYLERDIRAGIDVSPDDYVPTGLATLREKLASGHEATLKRSMLLRRLEAWQRAIREGVTVADDNDDGSNTILSLKKTLIALDRASLQKGATAIGYRIRIIHALIIHRIHLLLTTGRYIYFWMVLEIVLLVTALMLIHSLLGWHHILSMDVATFAATGVAGWIMIRRTITDVAQALTNSRYVINFSMVAPISAAVSGALFGMPIYLMATVGILAVGYTLDLTTLPNRPVAVLVIWLGLWLTGCAIGLIFGAILARWHFFRRIVPLLTRVLVFFSSIAFVSEQLPEDLKPWILWNPIANGMQLYRDAYFAGYTTADAQPLYFIGCIVALLIAGVSLQWSTRKRIQPA